MMLINPKLNFISVKLTSHRGDPCRGCGTPHDDVQPGPCPSRPSRKLLLDALDALDNAAHGEPFELRELEAQALLDALATL